MTNLTSVTAFTPLVALLYGWRVTAGKLELGDDKQATRIIKGSLRAFMMKKWTLREPAR